MKTRHTVPGTTLRSLVIAAFLSAAWAVSAVAAGSTGPEPGEPTLDEGSERHRAFPGCERGSR
jgi:hypothetical protein